MDFANYWFGSAGGGPDPGLIGQSLRFRGNQYLSRSFSGSSSGSGQVWTLSMWLKDSVENQQRTPFCAGNGGEFYCSLSFFSGNSLGKWSYVKNNGQRPMYECGDRFRDPSGWFHLVVRSETTNSNGALRDRFYINGREYRNFPTWANVSSQNQGLPWMGSTVPHYIGASYNGAQAWRGYIAEVHCCDGQSLGPENFGAFNDDGVWAPIIPTGLTYGNWGFHLDFRDPNNIGADRSGRGNHFTANGFELSNTASRQYDSMADSPTNNYPTMNPQYNYESPMGLFEANLKTDTNSGTNIQAFTTGVRSGRYYAEIYCEICNSVPFKLGIIDIQGRRPSHFEQNTYTLLFQGDSGTYNITNGTFNQITSSSQSWNNGDLIGLALDADNSIGRIYKNGTLINTVDFSSIVTPGSTYLTMWHGYAAGSGAAVAYMNAGQRPFAQSVPSGYEPLASAELARPNLPATITGTFIGNGGSNGPFVYTGCLPGRIQYGSVDVTYGNRLSQSNVDFVANGFKVRSSTSNSGTVSYTVTTAHSDGDYNGHQVPFAGDGVSPAPACFN